MEKNCVKGSKALEAAAMYGALGFFVSTIQWTSLA